MNTPSVKTTAKYSAYGATAYFFLYHTNIGKRIRRKVSNSLTSVNKKK